MNVIWKLKITGPEQEFTAPAGARGVKATIQTMADGQQPILYLICDKTQPPAKHLVRMVGTGQSIPDSLLDYVDTITMQGPTGPLVLHIFHKQLGVVLPS